ncbi:hypothetical protein BOTCAL_0065g00050 [Botryotinia calthae]|uniref:RING-type domain-containing protein n=1 Tax=Botryotinia calthae TaxID=38488 RepID=A0A4Y8D9D7_9HELO|nr:hypothetical protein BOTCAL_0065g00050 [Botryotinia calthae]
MCLTITLKYMTCGHRESYVRPCGPDSIRCNMMSTHTCNLRSKVCRTCWMLVDFRQAPDYRPEESMMENDVSRYQAWNLEAETQELHAQLPSLPLPSLPNQYAHFYSTNTVEFDLLNQNAIGVLDEIVHHHLDPAFQARIINADASQSLHNDDWRIAMGYRVIIDFHNSEHFTRLEDLQALVDECGICKNPFTHHDEGETNHAVVKTICNHIFHESCLERWFVSSDRGNCPMCRRMIRDTEFPQLPARLEADGPFPDWLTILNRCIRPVIRLELAVLDARDAVGTAREEFMLADLSVREASNAVQNREFIPREELRVFQNQLFDHAADIEEQEFRDYQYTLRQHQRTRLIRENFLRHWLQVRQEKDHVYGLAQSRYYTAARALRMARGVLAAQNIEGAEEPE